MIKESYEEIIELERQRQEHNVELIASENFPSQRVLNACGSILTNKYAEGYSGKRYYGGCKYIDMIETKAIEDVCKLFNCNYITIIFITFFLDIYFFIIEFSTQKLFNIYITFSKT